MEILVIAPEVAPFSGSSHAANVCGALPKALRGLDHRVTVVSPLYGHIDPTARQLARRLTKLEVDLDGEHHACEVYDGRTPGGVDLLFVGHEELFHRASEIAPADDDEVTIARRVGLFARATTQLLQTREPRFEVAHAHDWPAAAAVLFAARIDDIHTPFVLTFHDVAHQGVFSRDYASTLGIPDDLRGPAGAQQDGKINLLLAGIRVAHRVTTVSPTYAREVTEPGGGHGLEHELSTIGDRLEGILNGVDVSVWNPATDPNLVARFDPMDRIGKARCKTDLQRQLELPLRDDVPLVGAFGTTAPEEGFDLLAKCMPQVLRNDVQVALQLDGDEELIGVLEELSQRWPDRLQVRRGSAAELAHRIVGGSDLIVVPARHAPSGFVQMYAHRYGALPIVRRTGGLADTVVDCDAGLETGNGFLFDEETPDDLLAAIRRAIAGWHDRETFRALSQRVMRLDHSWERSARLYERLYRDLLGQ